MNNPCRWITWLRVSLLFSNKVEAAFVDRKTQGTFCSSLNLFWLRGGFVQSSPRRSFRDSMESFFCLETQRQRWRLKRERSVTVRKLSTQKCRYSERGNWTVQSHFTAEAIQWLEHFLKHSTDSQWYTQLITLPFVFKWFFNPREWSQTDLFQISVWSSFFLSYKNVCLYDTP